MNLPGLIADHGYWVLAVGCLLEGETVLLLTGFAARRGHLALPAVIGIAAVAGFLGDQFYFWLGRRHGPAVLTRWPSLARQTDRVQRWLAKSDVALIIGVRFAYGLRTAGPVLLGMTPMPARRLAAFNALGRHDLGRAHRRPGLEVRPRGRTGAGRHQAHRRRAAARSGRGRRGLVGVATCESRSGRGCGRPMTGMSCGKSPGSACRFKERVRRDRRSAGATATHSCRPG